MAHTSPNSVSLLRRNAFVFLALAILGPSLLWAASFAPPRGKVLHIAGQDRESIGEYIHDVCGDGRECPLPAGLAFYTSLKLSGVSSPHANEPGDNHQDLEFLLRQPKTMALQVGLYLNASELAPVAEGKFDGSVDRLARVIRDSGRVVYLRIGYEFDGPHNAYDPALYREAYRHIVDRLRAAKLTKVAYVWHSQARSETYQGRDMMEWYPGDKYVDWVGISYFFEDESAARQQVVEIARRKKLPVMICEASAIRPTPQSKALHGQAYWDYWYEPFFRFIESTPEIQAFSIIQCNWDGQKQWIPLSWGDGRLTSDAVVLRNWRAKMKSDRFLHNRADLKDMLTAR